MNDKDKKKKKRKADGDLNNEKGGGAEPLTEEEFMTALKKASKPVRKPQRGKGKSKT